MSRYIVSMENNTVVATKVVSNDYMVQSGEIDVTDGVYQYTTPSVGWFWLEEAGRLVSPKPVTDENWTWSGSNWVADTPSPAGDPEAMAEHLVFEPPLPAGPVNPTPGDVE
jgi:hypothetical protein